VPTLSKWGLPLQESTINAQSQAALAQAAQAQQSVVQAAPDLVAAVDGWLRQRVKMRANLSLALKQAESDKAAAEARIVKYTTTLRLLDRMEALEAEEM
jgi:hypothetical protein